MEFIYPDRPSRYLLKTTIEKIKAQLEHLGIDVKETIENHSKKVNTRTTDIERKKLTNLSDSPTIPMYVILSALAWRYLESKEDPKVSPRMNALEIQRLCLELLDMSYGGISDKDLKNLNIHKRETDLYPRIIYRHLDSEKYKDSFPNLGIVVEEKIGKNRNVYAINDRLGFAALSYWDTCFDRWEQGPSYSDFIPIEAIHFTLMLKRFLRFQRKQDFRTLEEYTHNVIAKTAWTIICDFHTELPVTDISGVEPISQIPITDAFSSAIEFDDYFSYSPEDILENYEDITNEISSRFFDPANSEMDHWTKCAKPKQMAEAEAAQLYGTMIFNEEFLRFNSQYIADMNFFLAWGDIVADVKKRYSERLK